MPILVLRADLWDSTRLFEIDRRLDRRTTSRMLRTPGLASAQSRLGARALQILDMQTRDLENRRA